MKRTAWVRLRACVSDWAEHHWPPALRARIDQIESAAKAEAREAIMAAVEDGLVCEARQRYFPTGNEQRDETLRAICRSAARGELLSKLEVMGHLHYDTMLFRDGEGVVGREEAVRLTVKGASWKKD